MTSGLPGLPADEALALIESSPRSDWPRLVEEWSQGDREAAAELHELLTQDEGKRVPLQQQGEVLAERYVLLGLVGQGVTGAVWKARDLKLERDVAVKIFDAEPDRMLLARAIKEARAAADVVSEHVLRVYDVVELADEGPTFIVMELIQEYDDAEQPQLGVDLSSANPRSIEEALRWSADAATGLAAAHTRAVYQRDVKLQNMLLSPVTRRVKVVDFGLATHQLNDTNSQDGHLSVTIIRNDGVTIVGTPACMAPEAARGLVADASTESGRKVLAAIDVFGVGAALYELLSGRRLYEDASSGQAVLRSLLEQAARGPTFPLPNLNARFRVPSRVQRLLEKALAVDPMHRYASVRALADDLEATLASRPTSLDQKSYALRARLWNRRLHHLPFAVVLSTLVLAAVISAAAAISADLTRTTTELTNRRAELLAAKTELDEFRQQLQDVRSQATTAEEAAMAAGQERDEALLAAQKAEDEQSASELARDEANKAQMVAEAERDSARAAQRSAEKERDESKAARRQSERDRDEARAIKRQLEKEREEEQSENRLLEKTRNEARAAQRLAEAEQEELRAALRVVERQRDELKSLRIEKERTDAGIRRRAADELKSASTHGDVSTDVGEALLDAGSF